MAGLFLGHPDPLGFFGGGAASGLASRGLSQLWLPVDQYLSARASVSGYIAEQNAWFKNPCVLPTPDVLMDLSNRGFLKGTNIVDNALRCHGIDARDPFATNLRAARERRQLWTAVEVAKRAVPDAHWITDAWRRGLLADDQEFFRLMERAGAEAETFFSLAPTLLARPDHRAILDAWTREIITDEERVRQLLKESGTEIALWEPVLKSFQTIATPGELIAAVNRGIIAPERFDYWLRRHGMQDVETRNIYHELRKGIPSTSDLVLMGIREGFRPELARIYDYYSEFPELTRPYWAKLGLDYPIGIREEVRGEMKELTLADIHWASHWHVMPLGSAFQAYQRFRPDRIQHYNSDVPNLRPFTLDDLNLHMRLADLPPGVRDWMVALSHPPLTRRDIHWAVVYAGKDRAWVQNAWMDLGLSVENAVVQADIEEGRTVERETRWLASIKNRAKRSTVTMIEGLYSDGTIDRDFAMRQLADAGLPSELSTQLLDIVDFGVERKLVQQAVTATGRDFLSGVLSSFDAETQLRRIGIADGRIRNYLAAWSIRRDRKRKQAETGKLMGWVSQGLLSPRDARSRLANLGWTDPDATLYLAEAEGKLQQREQKAVAAADANILKRTKEMERIAKEADAQRKKMQAEANRIAPRSVVIQWMKDGIITEDAAKAMLLERGYGPEEADRYIRDSRVERPRTPRPVPSGSAFPREPGSAHPAAATLVKWFKDGVLTEAQLREGLANLGYGDSDINRYVRDAAGSSNGQATP